MENLLKIKERIKQFAGNYEIYIIPALKFLLTLIALGNINSQIGYMNRLAQKPITLVIALAGSFLPLNLTLVILALIVVAHIYALSLECAIFVLALFLVMFLLYFRFSAQDSVAALLVPLSFAFKVPYVIPVSMGLVGTPSSIVSVGCGTIVYHVLDYVKTHAEEMTSPSDIKEKLHVFKDLADGVLLNKAMVVYTVAFALTVLIVYLIRRLPIAYSWSIAIASGTLGCFIIMLIVNSRLHAGVGMGSAFLGILISLILNTILQYFCFDLDYNHTEKVQFEDDEYYYYVKAVPKNTIKLPVKKVKKAEPVKKTASGSVNGNKEVHRQPVSGNRRPMGTSPAKTGQPRTTATNARQTVRQTAANAAASSMTTVIDTQSVKRNIGEDK